MSGENPSEIYDDDRNQDERNGREEELPSSRSRRFPFTGHQSEGIGEEDTCGEEEHVTYRGSIGAHERGPDSINQNGSHPRESHGDTQNGFPRPAAVGKQIRRSIFREKVDAINHVGNEARTKDQTPHRVS